MRLDGESDEEAPKGCCAWGDHTHCAKPWENCQTGLGGSCCSATVAADVKECERCRGEWIVLPQSTCDKGHSLEKPLPYVWNYSSSGEGRLRVRVLSYNLFWWHLFDKNNGEGGSAGKLLKRSAEKTPFDFMGFQECQQPYRVLFDAGMDKDFTAWHTNQNICMAYRKKVWELLKRGEQIVANDQPKPGQNFGQRTGMWARFRHRKTNETVLFVNHHGPLPLSTGGQWGGPSVAYNLLTLVQKHGRKGEPVFMTGDFNSVKTSMTVRQLGCGLHRVFSGVKFGGIDHIFSNLDASRVDSTANLGQGGSDHDAISAVLSLGREN